MKRSILVLFWVFMSATMFAQGGIDVAGIVLDEQGQELIGVSVQIKGKQGVGVVTDFQLVKLHLFYCLMINFL